MVIDTMRATDSRWAEALATSLPAFMDAKGLGSGPLEGIHPLTGGTQNILLAFERAGRSYVLRRPSLHPRASADRTMLREIQVLRALAATDVPHARLIAACADPELVGAVFYLMEPVDGYNACNGLPASHLSPAAQHAMGLSIVDALAALSDVDYERAGLADFGKPEGFLDRQIARWRDELNGYTAHPEWPGPESLPNVDRVARWLDAHRPTDFRPGIMHGDFHIANVMFSNDSPQVAAIVDWEMTTIGDPLLDLGWLLATWEEPGSAAGSLGVTPWAGFPSSAELVERYRGRASRDPSAIEWYIVLACYKLGIILEGTYARACAGKAPMETGERLHDQAISLFERARRIIA